MNEVEQGTEPEDLANCQAVVLDFGACVLPMAGRPPFFVTGIA